jgi:hypothetical protein
MAIALQFGNVDIQVHAVYAFDFQCHMLTQQFSQRNLRYTHGGSSLLGGGAFCATISPLGGALRRLYRLYLVPAPWTLPFLVSLRCSLARLYPK